MSIVLFKILAGYRSKEITPKYSHVLTAKDQGTVTHL